MKDQVSKPQGKQWVKAVGKDAHMEMVSPTEVWLMHKGGAIKGCMWNIVHSFVCGSCGWFGGVRWWLPAVAILVGWGVACDSCQQRMRGTRGQSDPHTSTLLFAVGFPDFVFLSLFYFLYSGFSLCSFRNNYCMEYE